MYLPVEPGRLIKGPVNRGPKNRGCTVSKIPEISVEKMTRPSHNTQRIPFLLPDKNNECSLAY